MLSDTETDGMTSSPYKASYFFQFLMKAQIRKHLGRYCVPQNRNFNFNPSCGFRINRLIWPDMISSLRITFMYQNKGTTIKITTGRHLTLLSPTWCTNFLFIYI